MANETTLKRGNMLLQSDTRGFCGPQLYLQGPGEFDNLFLYTAKYGKKPLIVIDGGIYGFMSPRLKELPREDGVDYVDEAYSGECCREGVDHFIEVIQKNGCDCIVGIGGGKTLDTIKLASDDLNMPRIIVPSSASNDNPVAALAVLYTSKGEHLSAIKLKNATELVLVDTQVIANAPARLFAAGIADALATWFEAQSNEKAVTENAVSKGYRRCRAGLAIAKESYEVLLEDGEDALEAVKQHIVTEALENVVEANILMSGLGFINTGCSAAHGIHSALSQVASSHAYLHGEKVAFGLVCQMILENTPKAEMDRIMRFMVRIGLPVTLEDINIERTEENLDVIVNHAVNKNALVHHAPMVITPNKVRHAIIRADELGKAYKAGKGLLVL